MAKVAAPRQICEQVSQRAVQYAREDITGRGWSDKAVQAIVALPGEGRVGLQTTAKYLMYQERGISPFVMWWAEGRVVPLPDGPRRAVGVGTPGWVTLPGGVRKWREQRWRHPGIRPQRFLETALQKAITESRPELQKMLMGVLTGSSG